MTLTLAFDVYGTLIDTQGVVESLERHVGGEAAAFSRMWREKQLEYSFRRGLMQRYARFSTCTREALDYTCAAFGTPLGPPARDELMSAYGTLPAFADVLPGLDEARRAGLRMFAFSNGAAEAVEGLLTRAGIRGHFIDVVSVDEVQSFKPDPAVYAHFLKRAGAPISRAWLVSSNAFDVIGAQSCGLRGAWVRRSPAAIFDPWGVEPTVTVDTLLGLAPRLSLAEPHG